MRASGCGTDSTHVRTHTRLHPSPSLAHTAQLHKQPGDHGPGAVAAATGLTLTAVKHHAASARSAEELEAQLDNQLAPNPGRTAAGNALLRSVQAALWKHEPWTVRRGRRGRGGRGW